MVMRDDNIKNNTITRSMYPLCQMYPVLTKHKLARSSRGSKSNWWIGSVDSVLGFASLSTGVRAEHDRSVRRLPVARTAACACRTRGTAERVRSETLLPVRAESDEEKSTAKLSKLSTKVLEWSWVDRGSH